MGSKKLLHGILRPGTRRVAHLESVECFRVHFTKRNQPNLWSFWTGTRSQYYELYEVTVTAIKEINNVLRVGGPATSNFVPDSRFDGDVEDTKVQKELADVRRI